MDIVPHFELAMDQESEDLACQSVPSKQELFLLVEEQGRCRSAMLLVLVWLMVCVKVLVAMLDVEKEEMVAKMEG